MTTNIIPLNAAALVAETLRVSREEEMSARIDALKAELAPRTQERADLALLAMQAVTGNGFERGVYGNELCRRLLGPVTVSAPAATEPCDACNDTGRVAVDPYGNAVPCEECGR
jgi:hypothetical protein